MDTNLIHYGRLGRRGVLVRFGLILVLFIGLAGSAVNQRSVPQDGSSAYSSDFSVHFSSNSRITSVEAAHRVLNELLPAGQFQVSTIFNTAPGVPGRADKIALGMDRDFRVVVSPDVNTTRLAQMLKNDSRIEQAMHVPATQRTLVPNDPHYQPETPPEYRQWNHANTDSEAAWDITTGDPNVVIAVVDTGVTYTHPDLIQNIWQNLNEDADQDGHTIEFISGQWVFDPGDVNGVDNAYDWGAPNGHIDDLVGWNFATNSSNMMDDPTGPHGTLVAGTAVAQGNNAIGVAGVCWSCTVMPVINGSLYSDGIIYATDNGADVINLSVTLGPNDATYVHEAIQYAVQHGVVVVSGTGNNGGNTKIYPASYDEVIAVSGTWRDDQRAGGDSGSIGANWGPQAHVAAPIETWSTTQAGGYALTGGTSISGPIVSGIIGLMKSHDSTLRRYNAQHQEQPGVVAKIQSAIRGAVDPVNVPSGTTARYIGTGRINALKALSYTNYPLAHLNPQLDLIHFGPWMTLVVSGTAAGTSFDHYVVDYGAGVYPTSWTTIGTSTSPVTNNMSLAQLHATGLVDGAAYSFRVRVYDTLGNETQDRTLLVYQENGGGGSSGCTHGCEVD